MFCPFCGKELPDGSTFCGFCGQKLEAEQAADEQTVSAAENAVNEAANAAETVAEEVAETVNTESEAVAETAQETVEAAVEAVNATAEEAVQAVSDAATEAAAETVPQAGTAVKSIDFSALLKNKKVIAIAAGVVVLLLIIIIAASCAAAGSKSAASLKGSYYMVYDSSENFLFYNDKQVKGTDFGGSASLLWTSVDGTKALIMDGESLYYAAADKVSEITDEYSGGTVSMSANGNAVVYVADGTIDIYRGGKSAKVADVEGNNVTCCISPDGNTVAYADIDGDKISTYAWKGGKVIDLDAKIIPFSVSDGGSVIYGIDKNIKLNFIKGLKKDSAESLKEISMYMYPTLSFDHKQLLFTSSNGTYYFDPSLKEEIKVSGGHIEIIKPEGAAGNSDSILSDFSKFYGYSDGKLYKFYHKGGDFEKDSVVSYANDYRLSSDGNTIIFSDGSELFKAALSNPDKKTLLGEEVDDFDCSASGKAVYYDDFDGALRYANGKDKKGKKIVDDVKDFTVLNNGVCVFVNDDDELYYSVNGGEKKSLKMEDAEIMTNANGVVFVKSDDTVFVTTDGKKFTKTSIG